jgi:hypothetical protein
MQAKSSDTKRSATSENKNSTKFAHFSTMPQVKKTKIYSTSPTQAATD